MVKCGSGRPLPVSLVAWGVQVHEANVPSARLPLAVLIPGLRVSLAAAKAIALSNNIPLYGVSCFDAIASRVTANTALSKTDLLLIAIESKRKELYLECLNRHGVKIIEIQSLSAPDIITQLARLYQPGQTVRIAGDAGSSLGKEIEYNLCSNNPVSEHFNLGQQLGISGTPSILTTEGRMIPGYVSPKELFELLNG